MQKMAVKRIEAMNGAYKGVGKKFQSSGYRLTLSLLLQVVDDLSDFNLLYVYFSAQNLSCTVYLVIMVALYQSHWLNNALKVRQ